MAASVTSHDQSADAPPFVSGPRSPSPEPAQPGSRRWWAVIPLVLVAALLLLATFSVGAFDLRKWAPPTIFGLVMLAALAASREGAPPPGRWVKVMLAGIWGLAAWAFLSMLWAASPASAWEGAARVLCYAALVTLPIVLARTGSGVSLVRWIVMGGVAAIGVVTLVRMFAAGLDVFLAGRLDAPVDYRNATACLFGFAFWPLLSAAAPNDRSRVLRALALSLASLMLALAFLTQSRSVVIGLGIGGVIALGAGPDRVRRAWLALLVVVSLAAVSQPVLTAYHAYDGGHGVVTAHDVTASAWGVLALMGITFALGLTIAVFERGLRARAPVMDVLRTIARVGLAVVAVVAVVGGLAAIGNPASYAKSKWDDFRNLESRTSTSLRLTSTGGQRYDLWRVAIDEFTHHPLAGVGMNNYAFSYYRERRTDRNLDNAHGIGFDLLADTGVVGTGLFGLFLVAAVAAIATRWRRLSLAAKRSVSSLAAAGAVVLGQAMFDWEWFIAGIMGLGLFCLGLAVAQAAWHPGSEPRSPRPRRWPLGLRIATATTLALAAAAVGALFMSDHYVRKARAAADRSPSAQLAIARTAAKFNPLSIDPVLLQASALESEGRLREAKAQLEAAARQEPENFVVYGLLGDFEVRRHHDVAARAYYRRALALNPRDVGLQALARTRGR